MHRTIVAAIAMCACTAPPLPSVPVRVAAGPGHTVAYPGESMQYQVSVHGLTLAHAQVAVGQPGWIEGRRAIIVRAHVSTNAIFDFLGQATLDLVTTIDLATGSPIRSVIDAAATVDGKHEHEHKDHVWPADEAGGHDVLSVAGAIRAWQSHPDEHLELAVGLTRHLLHVAMWDAGRERIANVPAIHYDGVVDDDLRVALWVSDDASRVPLRFEVVTKWGTLVAELTEYLPPPE
jgi:hypothetical protein